MGAGDEGGVDGEEGIFGGGSDEDDEALLDVAEEDVLLGFVEAVDFVEEEDGAFGGVAETEFGFGEDFADFFDADGGGIEVDEMSLCVFGVEVGEGGFAGARGAVEDEGGEAVGFDHAAEEFAGAEDVGLAGELVEGGGAHAGGEGHGGGAAFFAGGFEEVRHGSPGWGDETRRQEGPRRV